MAHRKPRTPGRQKVFKESIKDKIARLWTVARPSPANHDDNNGEPGQTRDHKGTIAQHQGCAGDDSILLTSLSCNHDSLHFIYLATKRGRYPLKQTAMYTLHYSVCMDLGLGHTANAC